MLKEKYCDSSHNLLPEYPSFYQFRYYYRKHKNMQKFYISRDGLSDYQRNSRPLTGNGIQEFASSVGVGMLDSTICDIYLVNESGGLVGRPLLTACIDAYSSLCLGYTLSWEGGVYSLTSLMTNIIVNKQEWCKKFGISISKDDWNCNSIPATLVTDMGSEYKSETFEQIAELGVSVINLPPYRPELKGAVEKFFDLIQDMLPERQHDLLKIFFRILGIPFIPLFKLLAIPEAAAASQTVVIGFADMFLPSVIAAGFESEMTRFIVAATSVTQLIYMSEIGSIIMGSKIPVSLKNLFIIFLERTIVTLPVIALFAHLIF